MHYSKIVGLLLVISPYAWGMEEKESQENKTNQPREYRIPLVNNKVLIIRKRTDGEKRNSVTDSKPGERESLLTKETKKPFYGK